MKFRTSLAVLTLLLLAGCALQRDGHTRRVGALAMLRSFNAELLTSDSATLTLERWCIAHHLDPAGKVAAERVTGIDKPASAAQRTLLQVSGDEPLRYRRVRLRCGARVLSEADNWYVPARLTPAMNHSLDTSDVAFGRAVQALQFRRRTLSAQLLRRPLPQGWKLAPRASGKSLRIPEQVLRHIAILTLPDGRPISMVVESYLSGVMDFPPDSGG